MGTRRARYKGIVTVVKEIHSELRELVVWVRELEIEDVKGYSIVGPMLRRSSDHGFAIAPPPPNSQQWRCFWNLHTGGALNNDNSAFD